LVPDVAVGAVGTPVNAGLARSAPPAPVISEASKVMAPVLELKLVTPADAAIAEVTKAVVAN